MCINVYMHKQQIIHCAENQNSFFCWFICLFRFALDKNTIKSILSHAHLYYPRVTICFSPVKRRKKRIVTLKGSQRWVTLVCSRGYTATVSQNPTTTICSANGNIGHIKVNIMVPTALKITRNSKNHFNAMSARNLAYPIQEAHRLHHSPLCHYLNDTIIYHILSQWSQKDKF